MKRPLTKEQKKVFRDYYLDRAKMITGQVILGVFGLLIPMTEMLMRKIFLPVWICLPIAGVGLVMILTTRTNKNIEEEEKRMRR